jgi:hypothetical protein
VYVYGGLFSKVEATQYRGSVGLPEGRLDDFSVKMRRFAAQSAEQTALADEGGRHSP